MRVPGTSTPEQRDSTDRVAVPAPPHVMVLSIVLPTLFTVDVAMGTSTL